MKRRRYLGGAAFVLAAGAAAFSAASEPAFRAGSWEIARHMTGAPHPLAPRTDRYCITPAQLRADPAAPLMTQPPAGGDSPGPQCLPGEATLINGHASLGMACKGSLGSLNLTWTGRYTETSFAMTSEVRVAFISAKMFSSGRYVGACD
jgi:hypothetical protein